MLDLQFNTSICTVSAKQPTGKRENMVKNKEIISDVLCMHLKMAPSLLNLTLGGHARPVIILMSSGFPCRRSSGRDGDSAYDQL